MAEKIGKYEERALLKIKESEGIAVDMDETELFTRMEILSRYSTCVVLSAEESYGFLPLDLVRDKDGNASALALAEVLAFLGANKKNPLLYLDELYKKYGYHQETTKNIYFEGAEGSATIEALTQSYRSNPLRSISDFGVSSSKDFLEKGFLDEDEEVLVEQNFILLSLDNGFHVAIRPSGTEPKIKYYLFGCGDPNPANLSESKAQVCAQLEEIGNWLVDDAHERAHISKEPV